MSGIRRIRVTAFQILILLPIFIGLPGHAPAQAPSNEVPENARAMSYGNGWRCNPGYRESDGACAAIDIPEFAYATDTSYGSGWKCSHGFEEVDGSCAPIRVPANAYLDAVAGGGWKCSRGFRAADNACVAIDVPENGYLKDSHNGLGWQCDRAVSELTGQQIDCMVLRVHEARA